MDILAGKGIISDKRLHRLSETIGDHIQMVALGLELGFSYQSVHQYQKMNHSYGEVNANGTTAMLFEWRKRLGDHGDGDQYPVLFTALNKTGLTAIAEDHLLQGNLKNTLTYENGLKLLKGS